MKGNARLLWVAASGAAIGFALCICCGGFLLMRPVGGKASPNGQQTFSAGENAYLHWNGEGRCYLPRTWTDNEQLWTFIRAGNRDAIKELSSRMLMIDENTKVAIVRTYRTSCAVRVLEGEHRGELGFAAFETLRKSRVPLASPIR